MNKQLLPYCLFCLLMMNASILQGQLFSWQTGMGSYFDNREYQNSFDEAKTLFGANAYGMAGIETGPGSTFAAGMLLNYSFGHSIDWKSFHPVMYYRYSSSMVKFAMGAMPRIDLPDIPRVLRNDTVSYLDPTLDGIYLHFGKAWVKQDLWLDWTSMQTTAQREIFQVGGTGSLSRSLFFYRHDFILTHYAFTRGHGPEENLNDNLGFMVRAGMHLSRGSIDSLYISTGYCLSADRLRSVYDWQYYHGSLTELYIEVHRLYLRTSHYFGEGQVQYAGDPLFRATNYQRMDLGWLFLKRKGIEACVESGFHLVEGELDLSQTVLLRVDLSGNNPLKLRQTQ